jgi:3D (Asp-Asp-Asp) domain-containing protein
MDPIEVRGRFAWRAIVVATVLIAAACGGRSRPRTSDAGRRPAGQAVLFTATAYCTGTITATGTRPNERTVAADPKVLPMGSRIRLSGLAKRYNRAYVVGDTGGLIRGRRIDLYMRDCQEAIAFGRRSVEVLVLR